MKEHVILMLLLLAIFLLLVSHGLSLTVEEVETQFGVFFSAKEQTLDWME